MVPGEWDDQSRGNAFSERCQGVLVGLAGMRVGGTRRVEVPALSRAGWGRIEGIPDDIGHIVGSFYPVLVSPPVLTRSYRAHVIRRELMPVNSLKAWLDVAGSPSTPFVRSVYRLISFFFLCTNTDL